jgi:hypothetical protein
VCHDLISPAGAIVNGLRRRCGRSLPVSEPKNVVGGADDRPLAAYFLKAAQQELAETARLFDLPEHWLGQLLKQFR